MPVWRLVPVDLSDASWEASSHRGPAVVRAADETSARDAAEVAFGVSTRFPPGEGVKAPPWKRPNLVRVEMIDDPRYPAEGPGEVLEPSFAGDLAAQAKPK